jgi:hypothetical protein
MAGAVRTTIRINTLCAIAGVARTARAAVSTRSFVVAHSVHVAVVLISVTWKYLFASTRSKRIARFACTVVRIHSGVRTVAIAPAYEPRVLHGAVVYIIAVLPIAVEPIWACTARIPILRCNDIRAPHAIEARLLSAAIRVKAHHASTTVTCTARAAMGAWTLMIANCVRITVIFCVITWEDLFACAFHEHVACKAGTIVRVCSSVCTAATNVARIADAVVDVFTRDAVAAETVRARTAYIAFERRRLIVAHHAIKARFDCTTISVGAFLASSSVACSTRAVVQPWACVATDRIFITII